MIQHLKIKLLTKQLYLQLILCHISWHNRFILNNLVHSRSSAHLYSKAFLPMQTQVPKSSILTHRLMYLTSISYRMKNAVSLLCFALPCFKN